MWKIYRFGHLEKIGLEIKFGKMTACPNMSIFLLNLGKTSGLGIWKLAWLNLAIPNIWLFGYLGIWVEKQIMADTQLLSSFLRIRWLQ